MASGQLRLSCSSRFVYRLGYSSTSAVSASLGTRRDALRRLSDQLDSDQDDENEPGAANPGQPGIE